MNTISVYQVESAAREQTPRPKQQWLRVHGVCDSGSASDTGTRSSSRHAYYYVCRRTPLIRNPSVSWSIPMIYIRVCVLYCFFLFLLSLSLSLSPKYIDILMRESVHQSLTAKMLIRVARFRKHDAIELERRSMIYAFCAHRSRHAA